MFWIFPKHAFHTGDVFIFDTKNTLEESQSFQFRQGKVYLK